MHATESPIDSMRALDEKHFLLQSVKVEPKNLIGRDMNFLPSPTFQLPRIPIFGGGDGSPAYFDIKYLDEDLLIIQQNSVPGADGKQPC